MSRRPAANRSRRRRRNRRRTPIRDVARKTLALGLALTAVLLLLTPDDRPANAAVTVVVATRNIPAGTAISDADIELVERDPSIVPPAALTSIDEARSRTTVGAVGAGNILSDTRLAGPGAYDVPPGFVPLVIPIADKQTLTTLELGACIDVYAGYAAAPVTPVATQAILLDVRRSEGDPGGVGASEYGAAQAHIVAAIANDQVTTVVSSFGAEFILATLCLAWPPTGDQEPS